jgi:hypothetical protein
MMTDRTNRRRTGVYDALKGPVLVMYEKEKRKVLGCVGQGTDASGTEVK